MTVRLGVLGAASIAWRRTLPAMSQVDGLRLVAVASRDPDRAARFTDRFGGEPVDSYDRLLARDDIDAVYAPLPTGLHHDLVSRALTAGKHVLAEKPLATTADEARDLAALARRRGLILRENFMFLYHGQHAAVRQLVDTGAIGELRAVTAVFGIPPLPDTDVRYDPALGGGALLDVGVYPIRLARTYLGPDVRVQGATLRYDRGVDVAGSALLSGTVPAQLTFGFTHDYRNAYELWGSTGRIVVERAFTPPPDFPPAVTLNGKPVDLPPDDQFRNITADFVRAVEAARLTGAVGGADVTGAPVDADAAVAQAVVVDAVRAAAGG